MGLGAGYNQFRRSGGGNPFYDAVSGYAGGLAASHKAEREKLQLAELEQEYSATTNQRMKATRELIEKDLYQNFGEKDSYSVQEQYQSVMRVDPGLAKSVEDTWNHPAFNAQREGISPTLKGKVGFTLAPDNKLAVTMTAGQNGDPEDDPERVGVVTKYHTKAKNDPIETLTPLEILDKTITMTSAKAGIEHTLSGTDTLVGMAATPGLSAPVQTNQPVEANAAAASTAIQEETPAAAPMPDAEPYDGHFPPPRRGDQIPVERRPLVETKTTGLRDYRQEIPVKQEQMTQSEMGVEDFNDAAAKAEEAGDEPAAKQIRADQAKMVTEVTEQVPDMPADEVTPQAASAVKASLESGDREFDYYTKTAGGRAGLILAAKQYGLPTMTNPHDMAVFINTGKYPDPNAATILSAGLKQKAATLKSAKEAGKEIRKMVLSAGTSALETAGVDKTKSNAYSRFENLANADDGKLAVNLLRMGMNSTNADGTPMMKIGDHRIAATYAGTFLSALANSREYNKLSGKDRASLMEFIGGGEDGSQRMGEGYATGFFSSWFTGSNSPFKRVLAGVEIPPDVKTAFEIMAEDKIREQKGQQ